MTQHWTAAALSALSQDEFVAALSGVFEHSPWVAERAWSRRPFQSMQELHAQLAEAMYGASHENKLSLIRAHPELAGKAAIAGNLTDASLHEQTTAGLRNCSPEEYERLQTLNTAYQNKFSHPFIMAVRGSTRDTILNELERRLALSVETEFEECLRQITIIARLRLLDLVN